VRIRLRILPALLALIAALAGCRDAERVAGGGGVDVEGITVEGTAMRPDGSPIPSAQVRLRAWDFHRAKAAPKLALYGGDAATDSLGRFRFDDVDTGRYALEVDAGPEGSTVLEIEVDGSLPVLRLEARVQPAGSLSGTVRDDSGRALAGAVVGLLGLDRSAFTDSAGAYRLGALPAGTYTVHVQPPGPAWSAREIPQVSIGATRPDSLDIVLPAAVPGLFAQWRFDEGKGGLAADALGSEARTVLHGPAGWGEGHDGPCLSLPDTVAAYAFVPKTKSSALDIGAGVDFTISLWYRSATAGAGSGRTRRLADARADYAPNGWSLGLTPEGGMELLFQALGESAPHRLAAGTALDDGAWHHVAAGRIGSRWFLYLDGIAAAASDGPDAALTHGNAVWFGAREGKADHFPGLLDDIRLYARGLSAAEIAALPR
jgi:hypothetical protein